jgi:predicted AAA+ superfamily ATPase
VRRYLDQILRSDLTKKMVLLTGPRQVGKTTVARSLLPDYPDSQYLNWDVPADRRVLLDQAWSPRAGLLVFDEIHKMRGWKPWLKGVFDGRTEGQAILVTGSARMDTFRQSGESLAGRHFALRLHPVSVREWCVESGADPDTALDLLLERGGFPEPFLASRGSDADRWRNQVLEGLIREDIVEFSRIHEVRVMRTFVEMLRERVGSPLSLASIARDLQVSPTTLTKYLEILEALYVVFVVRPFHHNIGRAILKAPKVYFFDTGLVRGDDGARFENACAAMLLKHADWLSDVEGRTMSLHFIRDKEGREVDFVACDDGRPVLIVECKSADPAVAPYLATIADRFPEAAALQIVRHLRQPEQRGRIEVQPAAKWLAGLKA